MERALLNCQLSSWFPSCKTHAYKTELIELSEAFLKYLTEDGVFVSELSQAVSSLPQTMENCMKEQLNCYRQHFV